MLRVATLLVTLLTACSILVTCTPATIGWDPCSEIHNAVASQSKENGPYLVDAEDAHNCLKSIALEKDANIAELEGVKQLVQLQSTLGYLKHPPPAYLYDAVDIMKELHELRNKLTSDFYESEYDFQLDLYSIMLKARDGHLSYKPDIVGVFEFRRPLDLVSVSVDGTSLPQVYAYSDLHHLQSNNAETSGYTPSPIVAIQGQSAVDFLGARANTTGRNQDPDANYNALFPNIPQATTDRDGLLENMVSTSYPGPSTTFTFENGTITTLHNFAIVRGDKPKAMDSGKEFFTKCCRNTRQGLMPSLTHGRPFIPTPKWSLSDLTGKYPNTVVSDSEIKAVAGFFSDIDDLAILSVRSFLARGDKDESRFLSVARNFIASAKASGKKKLIIDLRGNRGGLVVLGHGLFKIIFPSLTPYEGTNIRAPSVLSAVGRYIARTGMVEHNVVLPIFPDSIGKSPPKALPSWLNYRVQLNERLEKFKSSQAYYGPYLHHGDHFLATTRYDFNAGWLTGGLSLTGGDDKKSDHIDASFAPEDIVILQDGLCASTCAAFTEAAKTEAGVRQIVMGGRPQTGPMQGVGSVKGAEITTFDVFANVLNSTEAFGSDRNRQEYKNINQALDRQWSPATVNLRNAFRRGDEAVIPLQFVYEAADCRLFYTPDMYGDQSNVWRAAYEAMWGDGNCVPRSTGHPSSRSAKHKHS